MGKITTGRRGVAVVQLQVAMVRPWIIGIANGSVTHGYETRKRQMKREPLPA